MKPQEWPNSTKNGQMALKGQSCRFLFYKFYNIMPNEYPANWNGLIFRSESSSNTRSCHTSHVTPKKFLLARYQKRWQDRVN